MAHTTGKKDVKAGGDKRGGGGGHDDVMNDLLRAAEGKGGQASSESGKLKGGEREGGGAHTHTHTHTKETAEQTDQDRKVSAIQRLKARKLVYDLKRLLHDASETSNKASNRY